MALTIDDGFDPEVIDAYLRFAHDTGYPLTLDPVGVLQTTWTARSKAITPLVERGQVQLGNHTYHHHDLTRLSTARIQEEVERNDDWVRRAFGVTTRPYVRPPLGLHDQRVDDALAGAGYPGILMWQGSFEDAKPTTPAALLDHARAALMPGAIVLGHANHPTVTTVYSQLVEIIREQKLRPVTLDTMFGTSRSEGRL